jgi:BirA family biotin operon repressor/biotin-[acetyl-CoA-carboxylase] ligase
MTIPDSFVEAIQHTPVKQYKFYESVGSTNQVALEWLENDAPDGAIVFADHQSSGRGRFDRQWVTEPGSAIAISIIIRPTPLEQAYLSLFSPLAGVALVDVLKSHLNIDAEIKWPNDVLIQRQKTAGILTESHWTGDTLEGLVVGIGINVFSSSIPALDILKFPATCLQNHSVQPINRFQLLTGLINSFNVWRAQIHLPEFMNQWQKSLAFRNEKVYIKQKDGSIQISGKLIGIHSNGDLEILSDNNQTHMIKAGDLHLRPAEPEE